MNLIKYLIFLLLLISCKNNEINYSNLSEFDVRLSKNGNGNVSFDKNFTDLHFVSYFKEYPDYYKKDLLNIYKDLKKIDTFLISQFDYNSSKFYYDLFKNKYLDKMKFEQNVLNRNIDTSNFSNISLKDRLIAYTGIDDNSKKQIVIIDSDRDNDLSNNLVQVFDLNFSNESYDNFEKLKDLPSINYNYTLLDSKNMINNYNREIIVFPSINNFYTSIFSDELNKKLHLVGRFKDYWEGEFEYKGYKYSIVAQGFSKDYLQILIKPDSLKFSNNNAMSNKNYQYNIKDTLSISKDFFVIDSIDKVSEIIKFKRINIVENYGFRLGQKIKNIEIKNINDSKSKISSLFKKDYILLDFWGTWCQPCIAHTQLLKNISDKYSNVSLVGIAYDTPENVKNYASKNQLNWYQGYISPEERAKSIISSLRIEGYPTYILLDKEFKIVYRETGPDNLDGIEKIISINGIR